MKPVLFFVWAVFFLACASVQAANIAVIAPKVGDLSKYGDELGEGAQIAVDILNEQGGLLGEKLNLVIVDDRCEESFAVSAAQMMSVNSSKADKVNLVVGPYCSDAYAEVADIYAKGKIIHLSVMPLSSSAYMHEADGLFKIGGQTKDEAKVFFDFYSKQFAGKNLALVYDAFQPEAFETAFEVQSLFRNGSLAASVTLYDFSAYGKDYSKMAKEILLNHQAVLILGKSGQTAKLIQELQENKPDVVVFADEYEATPSLMRELGNFSEGIYLLGLKDMKDSPEFTEELVSLRLKGKEPRGLGVYGYAAVKLWSDMVSKAGSFDFDKVKAKGMGGQFVLPWGKVAFQKGRASASGGYAVYRITGGEYAQVDGF